MTKKNEKLHDLRGPLNVINMQAELIKMLSESPSNADKICTAADKIIQASKNCNALLTDAFSVKNNEDEDE
jgi:signal transduction histidine kinase